MSLNFPWHMEHFQHTTLCVHPASFPYLIILHCKISRRHRTKDIATLKRFIVFTFKNIITELEIGNAWYNY